MRLVRALAALPTKICNVTPRENVKARSARLCKASVSHRIVSGHLSSAAECPPLTLHAHTSLSAMLKIWGLKGRTEGQLTCFTYSLLTSKVLKGHQRSCAGNVLVCGK